MKNNLQKELDELLTREQLAKKIGVHYNTIDNWRESGKLPYYHFPDNAKYGFKLEDVLEIPTFLRKPIKLKVKKGEK